MRRITSIAVQADLASNARHPVASSRPYVATLTVHCTAPACTCVRDMTVKLLAHPDGGELIERPYESKCQVCGHRPADHATQSLVRGAAIERRIAPRH
jgi:hypothetical protein